MFLTVPVRSGDIFYERCLFDLSYYLFLKKTHCRSLRPVHPSNYEASVLFGLCYYGTGQVAVETKKAHLQRS